ncbi:ABC transporter ATP-binding protein/permease [Candidatus Parcubacteria bacterium]|nr:ABC transporter ATP-binding protein/permease [Candidatus Parcubacteria bacterium]
MSVRKQLIKQAWAIFGPLKLRILVTLALIVFGQALSLAGPYIQGSIIDHINRHAPMGQVYALIAASGSISVILLWVTGYIREIHEINRLDFQINGAAADQTMIRMTDLSVGQHNAQHSGVKQSIIGRGEHSLTALVHMLIYEIIPISSRAIIMTIAMFWLSAMMGLVIFVTLIIFVLLTIWMNFSFGDDLKKLEKMWNQESKFRGEIIQHIAHVLVNAQESRAQREADEKYLQTVAVAKPIWRRFTFYAYAKGMITVSARLAIMALGATYVYRGQYSIGTIVVFWSWSNDALNNIQTIGSLQRQIMRMWTSIKRYSEFLNVESDVKIVPDPVLLDPVQGRIEVRNVSFTYQSRTLVSADEDEVKVKAKDKPTGPALQDVSFVIEPGETVAIVGESGSGKTTLASLLVRSSDPTTGQIFIDGQDLRVLDLNAYRLKVGVVEQHVPLFDRSVRDNILYGLDGQVQEVTNEDLERIAQVSQINRFSHKLEHGFDTIIGERGIKLSGGERQRVGIARALIKNPAILIFDEATSSLDAAVEAEIREAINEASRGRTTIIVAHRFSTIRYANRIIVMANGQIVGQGRHEDLYYSCEEYKSLVDHQVTEAPVNQTA